MGALFSKGDDDAGKEEEDEEPNPADDITEEQIMGTRRARCSAVARVLPAALCWPCAGAVAHPTSPRRPLAAPCRHRRV